MTKLNTREYYLALRNCIIIILIILLILPTFSSRSVEVSAANTTPTYAADRSKSPTDILSAPSTQNRIVVTLVAEELLGQLADGVTYMFWTFNGTIPGPFIRLREGQMVEMHIKNLPNSSMTHSIDSHAVLGTGGGSVFSQTAPGNETIFQFTAMRAGLFMYHCATAPIPAHIANGMYGLILVEPKQGLSKVDREFYVAQGEFYTQGALGEQGYQAFDYQKALAETPEYVVFNGRVGAFTGNKALKANVGESVRIFFLNAGPNLDSSFHVIGGILDRVFTEGSIISTPLLNVQTTLVPAGGAVMVEFKAEVPATLTLVDHSLFRILRGAVGLITVQGPSNPNVFSSIKNSSIGPVADQHMMMTTQRTSLQPVGSNSANVVKVENYVFSPAQITVAAGTTVTWVNKDTVGHTITEGDADSPKQAARRVFDSSNQAQTGQPMLIEPGQSWSFTFTTPGTYQYYCIPHPFMKGQITVLPSTSNSGVSGYGNFVVVLTGYQIYGTIAFGLIVLLTLMTVFARKERKSQ